MRTSGASRSRARPRSCRADAREVRAAAADRKVVAVILFLITAAAVIIMYLVPPNGEFNQSYQLVMLCFVVAAAAARTVLGHQPPAPASPPSPVLMRLALPVVLLAALLPYLLALAVGFLSDDFGLIAAMPKLKGPIQALTLNPFPLQFRPLHVFVWWVQHQLWGDAAVGYHAISLLFHTLSALLVLLLGRRLSGSLPAALIAGLLFALHPIHVETVAWVSCQLDLQAALLALLSLLALDTYLVSDRPRRRRLGLAAALFTFLLATLTKESPLALPALAALWTVVRSGPSRWRRAAVVSGSYAAVLVFYLALRFSALAAFGGYPAQLRFWNAVFPSAVLRQALTFFFPLNRSLLGAAPWLLLPALVVMGAFLLWCARNLRVVPSRRLGLYLGFAVLSAVPVWALPWATSDLEYTRFAYLPTIGLAWLIGDLCAGKGLSWRHAGRVTAAALLLSATLALWCLAPWLRAQRFAQQVLAAGARMVAEAPSSPAEPLFYVQSLPDMHAGAQVFRNGFAFALTQKLGREVHLETVSRGGDIPPEAMVLLSLQPGEYIYEWDPKSARMVLVTQGGQQSKPQGPQP